MYDYNANDWNAGPQMGFSWGGLGTAVGDTFTDVINGAGDLIGAKGTNAQAVASANMATAAVILQREERKKQLQKNVVMIVVLTIVVVAMIALFSISKK